MIYSGPIIKSFLYYSSEERVLIDDESILNEIEKLPSCGKKPLWCQPLMEWFFPDIHIQRFRSFIKNIICEKLKNHRYVQIIINGKADEHIQEVFAKIDNVALKRIVVHHLTGVEGSWALTDLQEKGFAFYSLLTYPSFYQFYTSNTGNFLRSFQYGRLTQLCQPL